ncbi:MAG: hypothetical protein E5V86_18855, partial [Mesorhizobium sp.]
MQRYREFMGAITHVEYDAGRGVFESVVEIHPFIIAAGMADETAADPWTDNAPGGEAGSAVRGLAPIA